MCPDELDEQPSARQVRQIVFTLKSLRRKRQQSRATFPSHSDGTPPVPHPMSSGDQAAKRLAHSLGISGNHGEIHSSARIIFANSRGDR